MVTGDVIGIDPSLTATGLAYDGGQLTIRTDSDQPDGLRLDILRATITGALHGARLAVVEDLPTHAHGAGRTGMAQGVIRLALYELDIPLLIVTPATLKKFATGKGNAGKADMRMALYQRAGLDLRDDNQVDAWWLRALGCHLIDIPLVELPKSHLVALDKVKLPLETS
jgi:Holliday junction resolvasome RuvABC endonuclease subunit